MRVHKQMSLVVLSSLALLSASACEGTNADEQVEEVGEEVEQAAEEAAEGVGLDEESPAEELGEGAEEVGEEVEQTAEEAADEAKE